MATAVPVFKTFQSFQRFNEQNLSLTAQLAGLGIVDFVVRIFCIDGDSVYFARLLLSYVAVAHVAKYPRWVAFQRIAQAASARGFQADDLAGMKDVIRVSRRDDAGFVRVGVQRAAAGLAV